MFLWVLARREVLMKRMAIFCINLFLFAQEAFCLVPEANLHDAYKYFLENTYWVVPTSTLLAYRYSSDDGTTQVTDQTVWNIGSYNGGFFTGTAYTGIDGTETLSQRQMLGTITNSGDVYITFYSTGTSTSDDLVNGIGTFRKEQGAYRFIMQMNSGTATSGLSHWSYMIRTDLDSTLPGEGTLTVGEFINLFP